MKGESPVMPRDIKLICDTLGVNREWLETGEGEKRTYSLGFDKDSLNRSIDKSFTQCAYGEDAKPFYVKYDNKKIDEANRKVIDYLNG